MSGPARPVLTERELTVLRRSAAGDTYDDIAKELGIHPHAVGKLASRMFVKLGARSMPHAVIVACRAGLLDGRRQHHGDHNGYEAHIRRGDEICDACRAGEKAYRARLREARQTQEDPCAPASGPRSASVDSGPSGLENASEAHSPANRPANQTKAA